MLKTTKSELEPTKQLMRQPRALVRLSKNALVENFQFIAHQVSSINPTAGLLPMVKANAYGHGALWAVQTLKQQKQLYGFGVATLSEAIQLRESLGAPIPILIFSDCAPWSEVQHNACIHHDLQPVFSELSSFQSFMTLQASNKRQIPFHWEFNTGMNRLGFSIDAMDALLRVTKSSAPQSIFTHLAQAELPKSSLTQKQMKNFLKVIEWSRANFPQALLHFANSAAIWNAREFAKIHKSFKEMHLARPGLSLYGIRPYEDASNGKLRRVMELTAPIINLTQLKKGDQVGYGGTYKSKKPRGEVIATIGAGYGDGVFRSLSNRGFAVFNGKKLKVLGRVSMDLTTIESHAQLKVGDRVEFWGENVDPYEQANAAATNPYELVTRMSAPMNERVETIYE